jgi:PqqD family protein of HPr-rel-A system
LPRVLFDVKTADTCRWRRCDGREFVLREWEDGAVLYDAASGDTHHLSLAAAQVLHHLHNQPSTLEGLATGMLSSGQETADGQTFLALEALVEHLNKLGLIEKSIEPEKH